MVWTGEQGPWISKFDTGHLWTSLLSAPRHRQAFDPYRRLRVENPSLMIVVGNNLPGAVRDDVK